MTSPLSAVWQGASKDHELLVHHKVCHARVLDYRRKFLEAAQRYIDLSYIPEVDAGERLRALSNAIICTILASAGRSRSKKLATLFKVLTRPENLFPLFPPTVWQQVLEACFFFRSFLHV